ncbi:hypothetical protein [Leptotrichia sp. oral taxon 847]|nr:hypothetical protein [Leptotrichia sp. oral taxon 847]
MGGNIHRLFDGKLKNIQNAMEDEMRKYKLEGLRNEITRILAEKE